MSRKLVQRAQQGDREAFAALADLYMPIVTGAILARTGNFQDTEDLVQETFLRALQQLGRLRDPDRAGAWLYGIALNVVRERRRERAAAPASTDLEQTPGKTPEPLVDTDGLRQCLDKLPTSLREMFILKHIQGLSYKELGQLRDASVSSVGERLWKARRLLRQCLERKVLNAEY